jgi:hypothetical protein
MSNQKTMTVQGVSVEVSQPYKVGHPVTEAEAAALNQTRAENIGNNLRKVVKDLLEVEGATTDTVQSDAQKAVTAYDGEYKFTMASVGGGSTARLDPLAKECRVVARNFIGMKLKEKGISQKDYLAEKGEDAIKLKIMELIDNPQIVAAAKKSLAERAKMASVELTV